MDNKGFTLIELISTIIILSIIMMIGIGTYQKVNENIKEKEYENKVSYIENKAALYASETGYLSTNVAELVRLGYVEADNEAGEVINPYPTDDKNQVLNDYVVTVSKEGENYYGHFTDQEEADINNIDRTNVNLDIIVNENTDKKTKVAVGSWTKENVILTAVITKEGVDESKITKITWYSTVGSKESTVNGDFDQKNTYPIEISQIMNTTYRAEVEFEDGTKFEARRIVKIDKQIPNIYEEDLKIENQDEWTNTDKKVSLLASDQNGSGIAGYYIGPNTDCVSNDFYDGSNQEDKNYKLDNSKELLEKSFNNGTYYICVKDNVGNLSIASLDGKPLSFTIDKVDKEPPTCKISASGTLGDNNWYTSIVRFNLTANDTGGSELKSQEISSSILDVNTANYRVTGQVKDNAGNVGTCHITVKRDASHPNISAIKNPLTLGTGDYTFTSNIKVTYGISGKRSLACTPAASKKTGTYDVSCTAISENGLSSSTSFKVKHSYPATYVQKTCTRDTNCRTEKTCPSSCGTKPCCASSVCATPDAQCNCGYQEDGQYKCWPCTVCCACDEVDTQVCDKEEYDCSYYTCPNDGTLNNNDHMCYY